MALPISPWSSRVELPSPDGKWLALYPNGDEMGMGSPTIGPLRLKGPNKEIEITGNAGASMVWSDDSRFLAFTEWGPDRNQILGVFGVTDDTNLRFAIPFGIIELHSFENGRISGIDSPHTDARPFVVPFARV